PTLLIAAMAASADTVPPSTWVELASLPDPGRVPVFAIAVDPVNDHAVIAGGGQGGLYRSADGGATWTRVQRGSAAVLTIAFSPFNPTLVLAGTRDGGALRIAAGPLPSNGTVRPLVLGTNTGLFISQDNGTTFTSLSSGALLPSTDYTQVGFTAAHSDRFYVTSDGGGGQSGGIWATGDSGQH